MSKPIWGRAGASSSDRSRGTELEEAPASREGPSVGAVVFDDYTVVVPTVVGRGVPPAPVADRPAPSADQPYDADGRQDRQHEGPQLAQVRPEQQPADKPPMSAPAIPAPMVPRMPSGVGPGRRRRATAPTIRPMKARTRTTREAIQLSHPADPLSECSLNVVGHPLTVRFRMCVMGTKPLMATQRFAPELRSATEARRFVENELRPAGAGEDTLCHAQLLVTELVTNAARHAHSAVDLTIAGDHGHVRIEARDDSSVIPLVPQGDAETRHRGLQLIEDLSEGWGVDVLGDGKVVWCELASRGLASLKSAARRS
jgi:anti-sigma regulatory factor (Ser/Thr protein kinase)